MQKEASETVQSWLRNRLVPRIAKVYLRKTPNGTKILLIRQSKTSVWHKQLLWTPPARHVIREGKRLACEKHMDWWPASTKPILQRYAIEDSVQLFQKQRKGLWGNSSPFPQRGCSSDGRALALHARGTGIDAPHLQFFRGVRKLKKKEIREAVLLDQNKTWICTFVRAIWKGSIWNSTELAEKAIGVPNNQGLRQKDVGGNITILIRASKTSVWHNQILWTPPARHVNRKGKRLACEKHMDWWPASTKPILQRYAIENSVPLVH